MANLKITMVDRFGTNPEVVVDGNHIKLKRDKKAKRPNTFVANIQTEKTQVELEIHKSNDLQNKGWFFKWLAFYVFGLFGFFSPGFEKCYTFVYKQNISLETDRELTFTTALLRHDKAPLTIEGLNENEVQNPEQIEVQTNIRSNPVKVIERVPYAAVFNKSKNKIRKLFGFIKFVSVIAVISVVCFVLIPMAL